jgi:hypothetical protein
MSPWERLLEKPQPRGHFLQLYQRSEDRSLVRNVSLYVSEGLKRREGVLVIATATGENTINNPSTCIQISAVTLILNCKERAEQQRT